MQVDSYPPKQVIQDVLACPDPPLPVLNRIVSCPIFAPDGTLETAPGYCPASKTFYVPSNGFELPDVPDNPLSDEMSEAVEYVMRPLTDFPFAGEAERAHAIAAMLLPFVRDLIPGPTPLHLIEAPTPGTGKTLLTEIIAYPALGRPLAAMTEGRTEEEWRSAFSQSCVADPPSYCSTICAAVLIARALASAITAYPLWEDRLLGVSEIVRVPVGCLWLATGNNPSVSGEIARRTLRIRLDPKRDRPWLREGFRIPNIREWLIENRAEWWQLC